MPACFPLVHRLQPFCSGFDALLLCVIKKSVAVICQSHCSFFQCLLQSVTELKEAIESIGGHKALKSRQEISKHVSLTHQRRMPAHFIDIGERVEAVWSILMQQDTSVLGLVGMGGVGTHRKQL